MDWKTLEPSPNHATPAGRPNIFQANREASNPEATNQEAKPAKYITGVSRQNNRLGIAASRQRALDCAQSGEEKRNGKPVEIFFALQAGCGQKRPDRPE